jgi:AbrB family looped-hinge helix DNA binding protein
MSITVVTVSSEGQIALPAKLCKELSIKSGDKLAAFVSGNAIMLKKVQPSNPGEFCVRLDEAREWAESVGYQESDVGGIIKSVRTKRRA